MLEEVRRQEERQTAVKKFSKSGNKVGLSLQLRTLFLEETMRERWDSQRRNGIEG